MRRLFSDDGTRINLWLTGWGSNKKVANIIDDQNAIPVFRHPPDFTVTITLSNFCSVLFIAAPERSVAASKSLCRPKIDRITGHPIDVIFLIFWLCVLWILIFFLEKISSYSHQEGKRGEVGAHLCPLKV